MDPGIFNSDGTLNAAGAVNIFFDEVTVRTNITPDLVFPIAASGAPPSPAMQQLMNSLQPSVTLSGRAGNVTVAPYGQAQGQTSWWPLVLGGTAAVAFLVWALTGK
jgi:hypothetical protein